MFDLTRWWKKDPPPEVDVSLEIKARAARAESAFPVLREAFSDVRERLVEQIVASGPNDQEAREYFYHAVRGLDAAMAMVETYARQQDMAAAMEAFEQKVDD